MKLLNQIHTFRRLYIFILISILYFLIKGIHYATIGSYIPFLFIALLITGFYLSSVSTPKTHRRIIRFWAILLIIWALVRYLVWGLFQVDESVTESHMREQFNLFQHLISFVMLILGVGIIRELKGHRALEHPNHIDGGNK